MNLFSFSMIIFGVYIIYLVARRAWKKVDVKQRMNETLFTESQYNKVKGFKEEHENPRAKDKEIKDFLKSKF